MTIQITDQQIENIARAVQPDYTDDNGEEYPLEVIVDAVENWLLRTINAIDESPTWHVVESGRYGDTMERFEINLQCQYLGYVQCRRHPLSHSIYCEEHQKE